MNIKNFEYLKDTLKNLGFGDKLNGHLEDQLKMQPESFKLNLLGEFKNDVLKENVNFVLDFSKSKESDMYFFNRYQATLQSEDASKEKSQTFYIDKMTGITSKEAYNLLSGRAVNKDLTTKDGVAYNAWLQLNFAEKDKHENHLVKQYSQRYGYDLEMVMTKYPIKEQLIEESKAEVMKSLRKGNLTQVTFARQGADEKMYIAANPQYKSLDVYDAKMKLQYQGIERKEKTEKAGEDKSQEKKEAAKQAQDDEGEGSKQKQTKRKGMRV